MYQIHEFLRRELFLEGQKTIRMVGEHMNAAEAIMRTNQFNHFYQNNNCHYRVFDLITKKYMPVKLVEIAG